MPTPAAFLDDIRRNAITHALIERLPALGLSDAWLVAGCLFQTVWNLRSGFAPEFGIRDYDIFYCDAADLSWEAENTAIARARDLTHDLGVQVELKNQARVHLWYAERFGPGYPQLHSSHDGIYRFLSGCTRVGVRPDGAGGLDLDAPDGLGDLYNGILRPNVLNDRPYLFRAKAESYRQRWSWLTIAPPLA